MGHITRIFVIRIISLYEPLIRPDASLDMPRTIIPQTHQTSSGSVLSDDVTRVHKIAAVCVRA